MMIVTITKYLYWMFKTLL